MTNTQLTVHCEAGGDNACYPKWWLATPFSVIGELAFAAIFGGPRLLAVES